MLKFDMKCSPLSRFCGQNINSQWILSQHSLQNRILFRPRRIEPFLHADLDQWEIVNVLDFRPCLKSSRTIMRIIKTQEDTQKPMNNAHFPQIFGKVAFSYLCLYKYLSTPLDFRKHSWYQCPAAKIVFPHDCFWWETMGVREGGGVAYSRMTTGTRPRCLIAETGEWGCQGVTYELATFGLCGAIAWGVVKCLANSFECSSNECVT